VELKEMKEEAERAFAPESLEIRFYEFYGICHGVDSWLRVDLMGR
jgi:hypothetical protein